MKIWEKNKYIVLIILYGTLKNNSSKEFKKIITIHLYSLKIRGKDLSFVFPKLQFSFEHLPTSFCSIKSSVSLCL